MKKLFLSLFMVVLAIGTFAQVESDLSSIIDSDSIPVIEADSTFKTDRYVTIKLDSTVVVNNTIVQVFYHVIDATPRVSGAQSVTFDQLEERLSNLSRAKKFRQDVLDYQTTWLKNPENMETPASITSDEMQRNDVDLRNILREFTKFKGLSTFFNKK